MSEYHFTSESVGAGHPDKMADQISDAIVDATIDMAKDSEKERVRCAVETLVKGDLLVIAGELSTLGERPDCFEIARQVARDIGYKDQAVGFDPDGCRTVCNMTEQSPDFAKKIDDGGAGDQGLMFGYACDETHEKMPLPITLAHRLVRRQAELRCSGSEWLMPDVKSQVTVLYKDGKLAVTKDGKPIVTDVVLSTQHTEEIDGQNYDKVLRAKVIAEIIDPVLEEAGLSAPGRYLVNPTDKFIVGGPQADAGLTGRKIIVDTYGGSAPHGGGAFSGKDPSKVDRSAAYAARYIAKNIVACGQASKCLVQLSYAIGYPKPVSVMVDTYGTGKGDDAKLADLVQDRIDLSPKGIIKRFNLFQPIYRQTATYGHFGRDDLNLPWEKVEEQLFA